VKKKPKNKRGVLNKIEQLKKVAIQAHYEHKGNVSATCSTVGIGRTQFYKWKDDDKKFADAIDNVTDFCIDFVEDALQQRIKAGDTTAIIFYLKTIGKKRGYIERVEMNHDFKIRVTAKSASGN
jgi:hypothetical protein